MSLGWPDIVIAGIAIVFGYKGFRRGFIGELAGFVAVFIAGIAALAYNGSLDGLAQKYVHTGPGSSHVIGTIAYAVAVYAGVTAISMILTRIAKMSVVGLLNACGGAVIGVGKALFGAWVVLYALLFFPLSADFRGDLHRSALVALVTAPDAGIDRVARGAMPWFVRPFIGPVFDRHHA